LASPDGAVDPPYLQTRCDGRSIIAMTRIEDEFSRFEHEGWERVANKYDSVWSSLTRQFIPYLIEEAQVSAGMSVVDVACGPGYVSDAVRKLGAIPFGIDFSEKMVAIAKKMFPEIRYAQGNAQD
jgi:ubiquinone/menaquinone biosynthesis C-methylase UbiE